MIIDGGEVEEASSSDESATAESDRVRPAIGEPALLEARRVINEVSRAVGKLETEAWGRMQPGSAPRDPLLEELAWALRACILAADKSDINWLSGRKARAYVQRNSDWRQAHYRSEAIVPYSRPEVAHRLRQWVSRHLTKKLDTPNGSLGERRDTAESVTDLVLTWVVEEPELLACLSPHLPPVFDRMAVRPNAVERVLEVLMRRSGDPSDAAEDVVRAVLRSLGYEERRVRSLFDLEQG